MSAFYKIAVQILDSADYVGDAVAWEKSDPSVELEVSDEIREALLNVFGSDILKGIRTRYASTKTTAARKSYLKEMIPVLAKAVPSLEDEDLVKLITAAKIVWIDPETSLPVEENT